MNDTVASWDRLTEFEHMIEAVFGTAGWYRQNWRDFRTKDGRTAADICRSMTRSTMALDAETCELVDEPRNSTAGQVARNLLEFYEGAPIRKRRRKAPPRTA